MGLYTSPHLADFRERIRVDGRMADKAFVETFIERFRNGGEIYGGVFLLSFRRENSADIVAGLAYNHGDALFDNSCFSSTGKRPHIFRGGRPCF